MRGTLEPKGKVQPITGLPPDDGTMPTMSEYTLKKRQLPDRTAFWSLASASLRSGACGRGCTRGYPLQPCGGGNLRSLYNEVDCAMEGGSEFWFGGDRALHFIASPDRIYEESSSTPDNEELLLVLPFLKAADIPELRKVEW